MVENTCTLRLFGYIATWGILGVATGGGCDYNVTLQARHCLINIYDIQDPQKTQSYNIALKLLS